MAREIPNVTLREGDLRELNDAFRRLVQFLNEDDPVEVTGARDDPEDALANLLDVLEDLGIITDSTTAS